MVSLNPTGVCILPDPARVIARPFVPGQMGFGGANSRVDRIIARIRALTADEVAAKVEETRKLSDDRHRDVESSWVANGNSAIELSRDGCQDITGERLVLLGMTFTQEYAFEAAALCNPSMVPTGDADEAGRLPFVMSTRAIGEGHISSIAFRHGWVGEDGTLVMADPATWATNGSRRAPAFERASFRARLREVGAENHFSESVLADLDAEFSLEELEESLTRRARGDDVAAIRFETERAIHWLATSNYEVFYDVPLEERVLSPAGPAESEGMEDARFVRFVDDDGSVRYLATYTAFDGFEILPQIIETPDFQTFRIATLAGVCARGKGMAIFPRRIHGDFVALARTDNESTFVMRSDRLRQWDVSELVLEPLESWELVQAGNCGSPIETDEGWLVLMHGVGPMRRYVLSAVLLDLDEPTKVLGRLRQPLLEPSQAEPRNGYVPNVVYSCGGLVHAGKLVVPYGESDTRIGVGTVPLSDVLAAFA
jgi:predicted GH43/DUF377 family glycosyl hydrolase